MKRMLIAALILLAPVAVMAQDEDRVQTSGSVTIGVQQVDVDGSKAQFNRFRDIQNGFYLYDLNLEGIDTRTGHFFDFRGQNLIREDQEIRFGLGNFGIWRLDVERNEIPFRISDKAKTPYIYQGNGVFTVGSVVGVSTPSLVPDGAAQNNALMQANDAEVAAWLADNLRDVELGTQRKRDSVSLSVAPLDSLKFRLTYMDERKEGSKVTYGPMGDRPPRTTNIQMPEPIDFRTRELRAEADLTFDGIQGRVAYQLSDFSNEIDHLIWQNIYFTPTGLDYTETIAGTPRRISTFGQRAVDPDNRYHNVSGSVGFDLPMDSRLTASAAYGWMKQDEALMPYSFSSFGITDPALAWNSLTNVNLPRTKADAEINTTLFNLDYTINPIERLNLRAFYRYYDLDNKTSGSNLFDAEGRLLGWNYVTQDTVGTNGLTTDYRTNRENLAYAYDKQNFGADARYTLAFWRTTLGIGYEREEIDRDFREADTDENIYKVSLNTRPSDRVQVRASYLYGDRKSDGYDFNVYAQSYTYAYDAAVGQVDNPQFLFSNHPDLRKYDVSDRERNQFDISVMTTPFQALDLGARYSYRKDDFDSGVRPVAPLANVPDLGDGLINEADRFALTPGLQLGLLKEERQNYGIDAYYAPAERWHVSAFANREEIDATIRGMVFNENQRRNPSAASVDNLFGLGPWAGFNADGTPFEPGLAAAGFSRIYTTKVEDRTNTVGIGGGFEIIPGRVKISTDYILSRGKVDWDYSGYGTDFPAGLSTPPADWETHQFGFRSPQTVRNNQYTLNASLEYQLVQNLVFGLHYIFDRYSMQDWMQEATGEWVEQVGSEFFLRDTSQDNRWGNRLVNMGTPLAGSYEAHVAYLTMTYRF